MMQEPEKNYEMSSMTEGSKEGALTVKRNKVADFVAKVVCLILGFFLWYYASASDTTVHEETFSSIEVEIVNESGLAVLSGTDATVDVVLSGKRSVIRNVKPENIRAYVDMSHITEAGQYVLDIQYDLPNGVVLESSTSNSLTVYADNKTMVSIPVKIEVVDYILEDGYELGLPVPDAKQVMVSGPQTVLDTIRYAYLGVNVGKVTQTVTCSGKLTLVDADGNEVKNNYVTSNLVNITATVPVYKYREVPILVNYRYGFLNPSNCQVTVEPKTVKIRGEVDKVDDVELTYTLNEKDILGNTTYKMPIKLPASVTNCDAVSEAQVTVKLIGMATKTVTVHNIEVKANPNGISYNPIFDPIDVVVCGTAEALNSLDASTVRAVIDLTGQTGSSGKLELPVTIEFPASHSGKVYEYGSYTLSVELNG